MTTYFVSRHAGALEWAAHHGLDHAKLVAHVNAEFIKQLTTKDTVAGTLPAPLIADVCKQGAHYLHLTMNLPSEARGKELTSKDMDKYKTQLEEFFAERR